MEQRSFPYSQNKNMSYYNNNSRNQFKSNNTVINMFNIIYDNKFVSLINDLSSSLKDCFKLINKLLNNIKEISTALTSQIIHSKCLLNDYIMLNKNNNNDKLIQVKDRLDFIDNNKSLLESNISFMNVNISSFLEHAKTLFKKMRITRNTKLNDIQNSGLYNKDFKFNNIINNNYNSNDNYQSKNIKNKRNYSSYDNMRYKDRNENTLQNYNSLSVKKNKSFKNISKNLLINSTDDINNNNINNIENSNNISQRQKTISFNLRRFMFNKNKNKINNILENISLNKENKVKNNNLLFNYCSLINNSKTKNNRKKVNKGNIQSLKNINSFKNDNRISNYFNNKYENRNDNSSINNTKKKINFNYSSNLNINKLINKNDLDNTDYVKIIENINKKQNDLNSLLANKIVEYFTLIKNSQKNKLKIEKTQKYLMNISLYIINKKENHISSLKHNYPKNSRIQENIMRNSSANQMKMFNSSGNDKKENYVNVINTLKIELNKKNEYIKQIKNLLENKLNNNGIVKAQNFEILQKRKILISIKKEINLNYNADKSNYKKIEELKNQINELKKNNINENNKNYKYKYELLLEEMNSKNNELNEINNKLDELSKNNNSLLNKLDEITLSKNNLEQEKSNLLLKIKKLEDFSGNKKIIITNSDEEPIENFSDIIEEQSSENEKEKNLLKENNKLQEKINLLQSELNKKILNDNDKIKKLSRNAGINEYENCIEFDPLNRIKKGKNNTDNNYTELKKKEDIIEKLQAKIEEYEKNKNNINFNNIDEYIILCGKNYKTLKWYLLTKKINMDNYNYDNTIWVNKEQISDEFIKNNFIDNTDEEKMIMNYLKKLEEKEDIISKLQLKIKNVEKNGNLNFNNKNMRSKSSNIKNILKNNDKVNDDIINSDFD